MIRRSISTCHENYTIYPALGLYTGIWKDDQLQNAIESNTGQYLIVDNIFGFPSYPGWGIRRLTRGAQPKETEAVLKFLGPEGPFFKAIYRLMMDRNYRLEFPVSSLPVVLDQRITRLDIPEFFTKKVHLVYDSYGQVTAMRNIFLNPFEYYFFMFAYTNMGIGASQSYLMGWGSLNDTLYTNMLDEYNNYFFPCDGRGVPAISNTQGRPQNETTFNTDSVLQRNNIAAPTRRETPHPTLFKTSIFQESANVSASARDTNYSPSAYSYLDLWRSETILHIFMEMWMTVDCNDTVSSFFQSSLPSVDLVRSVRTLVRHYHYFSNCLNHQALHPMEGLKRTLLPAFQRKLYVFLRHLFNRWPLDNTFRIVYETWLSYIQPWRYAKLDRFRQFRDKEVTQIEPIWFGFLVDNILFYTVLFRQMLPRCLRVDLTSPKNALMLFRTTKVFTAQDNMKSVLMDIEQLVSRYIENPDDHHIGGYHGSYHNSGSGILPESCSFVEQCTPGRLANIKQMLLELEPAGFVYKALFSEETKQMVKNLVVAINNAMETMNDGSDTPQEPVRSSNSILKLLGGVDSAWSLGRSDIPPSDKAKISQLLDCSRLQLIFFFDLQNVDTQSPSNRHESSLREGYSNGSLLCEDESVHYTTGEFSNSIAASLTPKGTLTEGMITPQGNPDFSHVRSNEIGCLVGLFRLISGMINHNFGESIVKYYYDACVWGKFARACFTPPVLYHVIEKVAPGRQIKNTRYLPPRVNLRPLGSYFCTFTLSFLLILSYLYGFNPFWIFLISFLCYSAMLHWLPFPASMGFGAAQSTANHFVY
ncbi:unnamed protein product [Allacma fusca]|uniref:Sphingomyelin phosphodiesterase 4 n=1 Tax=Allacma fusca TaxID=39272 RepID=A0A8J2PUV0_9HEXA|nr:unnamed protein product [Allacma fusca]